MKKKKKNNNNKNQLPEQNQNPMAKSYKETQSMHVSRTYMTAHLPGLA
jgi:hypothetical protein